MLVQLKELVQVRCGDKGNDSDITIFARNEKVYQAMITQISAEDVKEFFQSIVQGDVIRYEIPNYHALKFILKDALGGGASSALRLDNLGKTMGAAILRMKIEVEH